MRLGVLSSGGDSPGMNAAIRAVVRQADALSIEVFGIWRGYQGLVDRDWRQLRSRDCANILQRGGTILHTARCQSWMEPEVRAEAAAALKAEGIEGLIIIGGDGSFRGADRLYVEQGIRCAGIPGTIDNDLPGTELTLGFDTALNTAVEAIDRIRDTASSHERLFLVEVMGRHSGMLAVHTAIACGAEAVLYPEAEDDTYEALVTRLHANWERGKRSSIVVIAEGDQAGGAVAVADRLRRDHQLDLRVAILGHIQRGGSPSALDRIWGSRWGCQAVKRLAAGEQAFFLGCHQGQLVQRPLSMVNDLPLAPPPEFGEMVRVLSR
jgi:6-phosphofructokinase 1